MKVTEQPIPADSVNALKTVFAVLGVTEGDGYTARSDDGAEQYLSVTSDGLVTGRLAPNADGRIILWSDIVRPSVRAVSPTVRTRQPSLELNASEPVLKLTGDSDVFREFVAAFMDKVRAHRNSEHGTPPVAARLAVTTE